MLEGHLLHSLQHHLMDPVLFSEFIDTFSKELNRLQGEARGQRSSLEARISKIGNQLEKAVDAILEGADALTINARRRQFSATPGNVNCLKAKARVITATGVKP